MEVIQVHKPDEVNLVLVCEPGTERELYQHFSRFTKNYQFDRRYKNKVWNGKIAFFSTSNHSLPIGLLPELMEFAKSFKYKLEFMFDTTELYDKNFNGDEFDKYIKENLTLPFEPRDYQIESVKKALKRKRGVCLMPTSCLDPESVIGVRVKKSDLENL